MAELLERGRKVLFEARTSTRPHLDDKVLSAWNGLMISGLARRPAGRGTMPNLPRRRRSFCTTPPSPTKARTFAGVGGRAFPLRRRSRPTMRSSSRPADLYEAGFEVKCRPKWAARLQEEFEAKYGDPEKGGYFSVSKAIPNSVLQVKEPRQCQSPHPTAWRR